jgi:squalene synthase HpnC
VVADNAYAVCLQIARRHYENFPVASRLLPRPMRPHIAAIYAFARIADDFADEGTRPDAERLALLEDWERRLRASTQDLKVRGSEHHGARDLQVPGHEADAIFIALGETIRAKHLDLQLFVDLLSAFRQDVLVKRYETWDDLMDYCRRSANPVGRLVLGVAGARAPELAAGSDALCTALQLVNFWQDLERDWANGRLYVPRSILVATGAGEQDLDTRRLTPAWLHAMRDAAARTRTLFDAGRAVVDGLSGRLAWELRATWLGGVRILDQLEARNFDVFNRRPSLGWSDAAAIAVRTMTWSRHGAARGVGVRAPRSARASRGAGDPDDQT